ncbi:MAG: hypothetical protein MMC33_010674, partial [Icmadophila ericetorum]|nr:hypothetical protein [Icmadophila ericetorum]
LPSAASRTQRPQERATKSPREPLAPHLQYLVSDAPKGLQPPTEAPTEPSTEPPLPPPTEETSSTDTKMAPVVVIIVLRKMDAD